MRNDPFENDANFVEDIGMFEAATHPEVIDLPRPQLTVISLALDGSNRDDTVRGFASLIASRTGARVEEVASASTAAEILAAVESHSSNLLILPVPFSQEYLELKDESLGSVADQVLLKCGCPVLCVREVQNQASVQESLRSVLVPLVVSDGLASRAIGWAFRVTPTGGHVDLVAVADRDVLAEASHLMPEQPDSGLLNADQLSRALLRDIGGLVSAAQKRALGDERSVHVETRFGKFVPLVLAELRGRPHMIVWSITRDHASPAFHRAVDLLLSSAGPVLMV